MLDNRQINCETILCATVKKKNKVIYLKLVNINAALTGDYRANMQTSSSLAKEVTHKHALLNGRTSLPNPLLSGKVHCPVY